VAHFGRTDPDDAGHAVERTAEEAVMVCLL
jgi:hypothetical protein